MISGFGFRYILLDEKNCLFIKKPQHEENNIVTIGPRGSQRDEYSFGFPVSSPLFDRFNKQ